MNCKISFAPIVLRMDGIGRQFNLYDISDESTVCGLQIYSTVGYSDFAKSDS